MPRNMGSIDRLVRALLIAPTAIVVAVVVGASQAAGVLLLVLAGVMLVTAAAGTCPLYAMLGVSTRPRSARTRAA